MKEAFMVFANDQTIIIKTNKEIRYAIEKLHEILLKIDLQIL